MESTDERPNLGQAAREAVLSGGLLGVVVAFVWIAFLLGTHPDPEALKDARTQPRQPEASAGALTFDLSEFCSHCPLYVVAGRGLMHGYEMPDKKFWLLVNWPALALAARPPGRHQTAEVPLGSFSVAVFGQWFLLGAVARFGVLGLQIRAYRAATR